MTEKEAMKIKWTSRKFILCVMWWALLVACCIIDGEFVTSGFCMVLAITGALVNGIYILGSYIKDIAHIKYKDLELTFRDKEKKDA